MKSIQTKILVLILIIVIVCSFVIGGIGVLHSSEVINREADEIMSLSCKNSANILDNTFDDIEKSVRILAEYAVDNLDNPDILKTDKAFLTEYVKRNENLGLTIVRETQGAVSVYVRINPELAGNQVGYYKIKDTEKSIFKDCIMTDLSQYDHDDIPHVGWYYQTIKAGKPIWLDPYYNANIDVKIISYVAPIYIDNTLIGVVGMDINFDYITKLSDSIQMYNSGSAFVMSKDFDVLHQKDRTEIPTVDKTGISQEELIAFVLDEDAKTIRYTLNGDYKQMVIHRLINGMYLGIAVPVSEIDCAKKNMINQVVTYTVLIGVIFCLTGIVISRTLTMPIKYLNTVAQEVANGNYDVSIEKKTKDEIGELTDSLQMTVKQLKHHVDYISGIAYVDGLTGVKNHLAYVRDIDELKSRLLYEEMEFSVVVMDLNGLKKINDTYGHDVGNELLKSAVSSISKVYGSENLYRIGGDEFVVFMKESDKKRCDALENELRDYLAKQEGNIKPVIAIGTAVCNREKGTDFDVLFHRADERMYLDKKKLKENGCNSRYVQYCQPQGEIVN